MTGLHFPEQADHASADTIPVEGVPSYSPSVVTARLVYPPTIVSVSQTALMNDVHVRHLVRKFWLADEPDWLILQRQNYAAGQGKKPTPFWPWKALTACGQGNPLDACPVTWKRTSTCSNCARYWNKANEKRVPLEGSMVLLDVDVETWMERLLTWAKQQKTRSLPALDEAVDSYRFAFVPS